MRRSRSNTRRKERISIMASRTAMRPCRATGLPPPASLARRRRSRRRTPRRLLEIATKGQHGGRNGKREPEQAHRDCPSGAARLRRRRFQRAGATFTRGRRRGRGRARRDVALANAARTRKARAREKRRDREDRSTYAHRLFPERYSSGSVCTADTSQRPWARSTSSS